MAELLLAGDVGGTKTDLGLYERAGSGALRLVAATAFPSGDYTHLEAIVAEFLDPSVHLEAAAFGIAGPVLRDEVHVTNLPWRISAGALARKLGCPVRLLNDLEATAMATLDLEAHEIEVLQTGIATDGNRCVIAAGTGLGQSFLVWDGMRHWSCSTEGGHADFAPRDASAVHLLQFLLARQSRVSWESVLSGPGLQRIFEFVVAHEAIAAAPAVLERSRREDPSSVIGSAALAGECPAALRAVEIFISLYGAQAGNLALTTMATGGVYVAGGIVLRLLPLFRSGRFVAAFCAKEPFAGLMAEIPVRVILDPHAARRGAARAAAAPR